jgi:hypothetical protein
MGVLAAGGQRNPVSRPHRDACAAGMAIVLGHNDWSNNPAQVVSLLGWLKTITGAALLLIPAAGWKAFLAALHFPSHPVIDTIISAVVGAYLTYAGFVRRR